jgi:hypothetical protein
MLLAFLAYNLSNQLYGFEFNYVIAGNLLGCSIFTNIVFIERFWIKEINVVNGVASLGLLVTNILCLVYYKSDGYYSFLYDLLLVVIVIIVKIIMFIKKCNEINN